jgi:hypothetical protein
MYRSGRQRISQRGAQTMLLVVAPNSNRGQQRQSAGICPQSIGGATARRARSRLVNSDVTLLFTVMVNRREN